MSVINENESEWKDAKEWGTKMPQDEYEKLADEGVCETLDDDKAKLIISVDFGFMVEKIEIINEVETFEVNTKNRRIRVKDKYNRAAKYAATDWNYIRFNCCGEQYELINGELEFYAD